MDTIVRTIYNQTIYISKNTDCKDKVLSPDNDGIGDAYFIEQSGQASIYDRNGTLIKALPTPAFWDGTDSNSQPLPTGVYLIVVNNQQIQVTIVR